MKRKEYHKYFEILKLSSDASLSEIEEAYLKMKNESLSSGDTPDKKIQHIDEAYQKLSALLIEEENNVVLKHKKTSDNTEKSENQAFPEISFFNGLALKQIREKLNMDLQDVSYSTKVQIRMLEDIENDNYEALPPSVYVKGFVKSYAGYLSLDVKKVTEDYMKGYDEWKKGYEKRQRSLLRFFSKK